MHHFLFLLILRQHHHLLLILRQQWRCLHHLVCSIDLTALRHSPIPSMASDGLVFYSTPRPRLLALPYQPMTLLITMELVHTLSLVLPVLSTIGVSSQLCGVAIDVGTSLAEVLPLSVDQAFSLSHVLRRRSLDPADRATLVHRSTLFLNGLYRTPSSSMPTSRAQMVYVCALAMTFLFQPELRDQRMVREFQRRIGEFRPLLGLHDTVGAADGHGLLSHGL